MDSLVYLKGTPFIKGPFMWNLEGPEKEKEGQHKQKTQEIESAEINGGTWTGNKRSELEEQWCRWEWGLAVTWLVPR